MEKMGRLLIVTRHRSHIQPSPIPGDTFLDWSWWFRNPIPNHHLDGAKTLWILGYLHTINWCRISEPSTVSSMWSCFPFPPLRMNKISSDSTPSNCEGCVKGACKSTASSYRFKATGLWPAGFSRLSHSEVFPTQETWDACKNHKLDQILSPFM